MRDGGSIILTGSTTASMGTPAFSIYSASKAAIRNLARSWTLDLKGTGVRVNVLSPGATATLGLLNGLARTGKKDAMIADLIAQNSLRTHERAGRYRRRSALSGVRRQQIYDWKRDLRRRRHGSGLKAGPLRRHEPYDIREYRITAMSRKHLFPGLLVLFYTIASGGAVADLNNRSENSINQSVPAHRETNADSDQRFLAQFRAASLSLTQAIASAERLHAGSRTAAITFDISGTPAFGIGGARQKTIGQ